MPSFFKLLCVVIGIAALTIARGADKPSPMQNHQQIDFVALDPKSDRVILVMIETRSWGDRGALLPDFQEKLNTYLGYVLQGQLAKDYPTMKDKKVRFLLQAKFPLGEREVKFIEIVRKEHLEPRDIEWAVLALGTHEKRG
jgi:hypothetical protein